MHTEGGHPEPSSMFPRIPPGAGELFGELHAGISQALDCVADVTNGSVRGLPATAKLGFQLFAGSASVCHAYAHVVEFGREVLGGLKIRSGDLFDADRPAPYKSCPLWPPNSSMASRGSSAVASTATFHWSASLPESKSISTNCKSNVRLREIRRRAMLATRRLLQTAAPGSPVRPALPRRFLTAAR